MKLKKPVFLISYPSDLKEKDYKNLYINPEKERAELFYTFKHFNETELNKLKNISCFCVSKECPIVYLISGENKILKYDVINNLYEEIKKIGGKGTETGKFQKVKDCTTSKNIFIVADKNRVQAFSTITWQVLWVIEDNKDSEKNPLNTKTDYKFNPVKIRATDKFLFVYEEYKNRVLKFNLGGVFIEVIEEEENIVELAVFNNQLKIITVDEIGNSIPLPSNSNINSADFDKYTDLYIGTDYFDDEQGSIFVLDKEKNVVDNITSYKKKVKKLVIDERNILYVLGEKDGKSVLSIFKPEKTYNQYGEAEFIFDSTIPNCQWHRIVINSEIPTGTSITVVINSDNNQETAKNNLKKNGISFLNPEDIYIPEEITGQYIAVKIKLKSDSQNKNSPVFYSVKTYFPRKTYLDYLPSFYKEDLETKKLLNRYLSIFQTLNEQLEKEILTTYKLIDPITADPEFLSWLSEWAGIIRDENWEEIKWRKFLKNAFNFYKKRGTPEGIIEMIKLYTGEEPILIEPFQLKQCGGKIVEISGKNKEIDDFTFCIFLKPNQIKSPSDFEIVRKIVKIWKPAYTEEKVVQMKNIIILGSFVGIGINSYLYQPNQKLGLAVVPFDTVLTEQEESFQVDVRSRVGIDTNLKF